MGFFDNVQDTLDRGVSTARGAVSGVAVEQLGFVKSFVRTCTEGWEQGWHEANGGNMSYRLTEADVASARTFFYDEPGSWVSAGMQAACLAGAHFLVTRSGGHFRTMQQDPNFGVGIVQMDELGAAWRVVWGFKNGGLPTSELTCHLMAHAMRMGMTANAARVVYHTHTPQLVALSALLPADSRTITRALWGATTECIMAAPLGVGVVGPAVPGSPELARETSDLMKTHDAVLWARHGLLVSGEDLDRVFGLTHSLEKAANIYLTARTANGGTEPAPISDELLRAIARQVGITPNEAYL